MRGPTSKARARGAPVKLRSRRRYSVGPSCRAAQPHYLPRGLLTRAWLRRVQGQADRARQDLDEAWQIAERSSMRLFMADVHLARLRLFGRTDPYPWRTHPDGTPRTLHDDLAAARRLITDCGYHRRTAELADRSSASVAGSEPRT